MKLKFEGYSDDTFGEYGVTGEDVDDCGSMEPIQCIVNAGIWEADDNWSVLKSIL